MSCCFSNNKQIAIIFVGTKGLIQNVPINKVKEFEKEYLDFLEAKHGKLMSDYFKKQNLQTAIFRPLSIVKRENEFDVRCSVKGGGLSGQAGAIVHGISRCVVDFEPDLKQTLKKAKLTTRDSRAVERKKYGRRKARRGFQFSKR